MKPDNTTKLVDRFTTKKGFRTPTKVRETIVSGIDRITGTKGRFISESHEASFNRRAAEMEKVIQDQRRQIESLSAALKNADRKVRAYARATSENTPERWLLNKCREVEQLLKTKTAEKGFWEETHDEIVAARMAYLEELQNPPEEPDVE